MKKSYVHISTIGIVVIIIGCTLFFPDGVNAQLFQDIQEQNNALAGEKGANFTVTSDPRYVAAVIIRIIVSLLGFMLFIYTLYGGALIAFSSGQEDQIKKGKSTIVTGVIGILIMLSAYAVTKFVSDMIQDAAIEDSCSSPGGCLYIEPERDINPDPLAPPPAPGGRIF